MFFIHLILGTLFFACTIWASIRFFDPFNSENKFVTALIIGAVFSIFGAGGGSFVVILPLFALYYLLARYYDLGLGRAFIVLIVFLISNAVFSALMNMILLGAD